ncbi:MAG: extracellular solute-binding protein [Rhodocyclaceae bacterium]|nr:MAG: extracellular solute-binding protein [Rhodocyclaceae bacterium]
MKIVDGRSSRHLKQVCFLGLAMLLGVSLVQAQSANPGKNDSVYLYRGADRDQRLLDAARQEGTIAWYTSLSTKESMPLAKAFEKKYGIKVELWRATSDKVVQRVISEGQARRFVVDVVETNGPEVEMIAREKLLSEFFSPHFTDFPPTAIAPSRLWVTDRLSFFVVAYNTNKIKREDLPRHYEGFLDPKWKGQIGIEATDSEWMATIIKQLGTERGMKLFEKLAEMRPDVRKSHVLLAEMVAAGEVPVALSAYDSNSESLKRRGAPIDWAPVEPVIGRPQGIGVAKQAPHPHAALLFADFVLSPEGQELFQSMGRVPASMKVKGSLNTFPYTMVDPITVLDEAEKLEKLWNRLFVNR